jgi:hypothetical protein
MANLPLNTKESQDGRILLQPHNEVVIRYMIGSKFLAIVKSDLRTFTTTKELNVHQFDEQKLCAYNFVLEKRM